MFTYNWLPSWTPSGYNETLNDTRVASLGFFKDNVCTTSINREKNFKNQVPGPPKIHPNSAGLQCEKDKINLQHRSKVGQQM